MTPMTYLVLASVLALAFMGDVCVKNGSLSNAPGWVVLGGILYGSTAVGWWYLFRENKMAVISVIYDVGSTLAIILLGTLVFGEQLTSKEVAGLVLGVAALWLLVS